MSWTTRYWSLPHSWSTTPWRSFSETVALSSLFTCRAAVHDQSKQPAIADGFLWQDGFAMAAFWPLPWTQPAGVPCSLRTAFRTGMLLARLDESRQHAAPVGRIACIFLGSRHCADELRRWHHSRLHASPALATRRTGPDPLDTQVVVRHRGSAANDGSYDRSLIPRYCLRHHIRRTVPVDTRGTPAHDP